jgi:starch phosphorylase
MPAGLEGLTELALDMRWSWSHSGDEIWERLHPELWERARSPWVILQTVSTSRLKDLAADPAFVERVARQVESERQAVAGSAWFGTSPYANALGQVAYFSMEFGLSEALPIYSGGLGILAGDCLKSASDLAVPLVGVGLLYQQGYFRQVLDAAGAQREFYPFNDLVQLPVTPARNSEGEWQIVTVRLPGRTLRLQLWQARVGRALLLLLDSNHPLNSPADRGITAELYGGEAETRLQQEIVLGIGGWRALRAMGLDPEVCHLNEGHTAFAALERARSFAQAERCSLPVALTATRAGNLFTTHTPVEAGFDRFPAGLVEQYLRDYCDQMAWPLDRLLRLGRADPGDTGSAFSTAYLAVRTSAAVNGVSRLHGEVSRRIFQSLFPRWPEHEVPVGHITNGVHVPSWDSAAADELWTRVCGKERWLGELGDLRQAFADVPDEVYWDLRTAGRAQLVHFARRHFAQQLAEAGLSAEETPVRAVLDANVMTVCFARRFTEYKRPNLLLTDPERLARLLRDERRPLQLVMAGKAHPRDEAGKALIRAWTGFVRDFDLHARVVFLSDYDMVIAEQLVQGADLWLNTPRRPWEASGTSGMKVLANGGLNLSELDGWWAEAWRHDVGWAIGDGREHADPAWEAAEAHALYRLLENEVIPRFYDRDQEGIPRAWVAMVRASMSQLAPRFSANRMLREYVEDYYAPLAEAYRRRAAGGGRVAEEVAEWCQRIEAHWRKVRFGDLVITQEAENYRFRVAVYLDDLHPGDVSAELYAEGQDGQAASRVAMTRSGPIQGAVNGHFYIARTARNRPAADYTPRLVPTHAGTLIPLETHRILWQR